MVTKKYKILLKKIEGDLDKWKDSPRSWARRPRIARVMTLT